MSSAYVNESTPVTSELELPHCKPKTTWCYLCESVDVVTLNASDFPKYNLWILILPTPQTSEAIIYINTQFTFS